MPLPAGVAVPTVVPPLVHVVGAVACGPNTLNVIVFASLVPELDPRVALIDEALIAVPGTPVAGAATERVGEAIVTVTGSLPVPVHGPDTELLFVSPL